MVPETCLLAVSATNDSPKDSATQDYDAVHLKARLLLVYENKSYETQGCEPGLRQDGPENCSPAQTDGRREIKASLRGSALLPVSSEGLQLS